MSTVAESPLCSLHPVSPRSVYLYRLIPANSVSFSFSTSHKHPFYQQNSLLFPLSQHDTLRRRSQRRISHLEEKEARASAKFEQIHQDQKTDLKHSKLILSPLPRSLQLVSSHCAPYQLFISSAQLFISPYPPKLRQHHSQQLPEYSSYSALLPEPDSSYPIATTPPIKNDSK